MTKRSSFPSDSSNWSLLTLLCVCVGLLGCMPNESFVDGEERLTRFIQDRPIEQPDSWGNPPHFLVV